jgi:hypothetical protein
MCKANPLAMPCDHSSGGTEDTVGSHVPYHETVGWLTYLMTRTCPDMAFIVSGAARAIDRPTEADCSDVKGVIKHLRGTSNYGSLYAAGTCPGYFAPKETTHRTHE